MRVPDPEKHFSRGGKYSCSIGAKVDSSRHDNTSAQRLQHLEVSNAVDVDVCWRRVRFDAPSICTAF